MMNLLMMVAALAAPALSSATATPTCGKWLSKLSIDGDLIKTVSKPDRFWCKKACMTMDGCEAATYVKSTKKVRDPFPRGHLCTGLCDENDATTRKHPCIAYLCAYRVRAHFQPCVVCL